MPKIWAALIISATAVYISAATHKDIFGVWTSWNVLYSASKINAKSSAYIDRKLALNQMAIHSAPAPWNLIQRIELLNAVEVDSSFEKERLKTLWSISYLNEKER